MTSGNTREVVSEQAESTSENTKPAAGGVSAELPLEYAAALAAYQRGLRVAPLSLSTRAKYVSRVRGHLTWLASAAVLDSHDAGGGGDPLDEPRARDGAVRDWRVRAKTVGRLRPATINNTLAAIDDFYTRRGLGPAAARREALPRRAPKALSPREVVRYLGAVKHCGSTRDTVVALLPFYAGLRVSEVIGLGLDDVALSARKGTLRVRGKGRDGGKLRELPLTRPELRTALGGWLEQRPTWPAARDTSTLLLNQRGTRLSDRSARTIVTTLGHQAGLGDGPTGGFGPHTLRHCFATRLLRGGADPVLVADLLGHTDLGTLKIYTQPNDDDRERALALLTTDS